MNIYYIIVAFVAVAILIAGMRRGFSNGFVSEVNVCISLILSVCTIRLIVKLTASWRAGEISDIITGLALIAMLALFYKIYHVLFSMINFLTKLPVLHTADKALGIVIGLAEGFVILYALEYILRHIEIHIESQFFTNITICFE